jgi:dihydroorotate dehydrogenase electron transfer subunit
MQQLLAPIIGVGVYEPLLFFYRLRLVAPTLVSALKPGQFLLVNTATEYVRRPFFPITIEGDCFSLLLPPASPLRQLGPGDELDCIGPLGNGFPLPANARNLLLLAHLDGSGITHQQNGVSFLLTLIDQALEAGRNVLLIQEAPTATALFPHTGLPPGVEVRLVTDDGSRGQAGTALDLIPELAQWADQIYAVGAPEWYGALVRTVEVHRLRLGEGLMWGLIAPEVMPCGLGACDGCAVDTRRGYQLACTDGPVFDLTKI